MMHGENISLVEILDVSPHGFSLLVDGETLHLRLADFPWFDGVSRQQLQAIERPAEGHLYWPELDIDLSFDSIRDPAAFPLVASR
jgi:hypothetical protein